MAEKKKLDVIDLIIQMLQEYEHSQHELTDRLESAISKFETILEAHTTILKELTKSLKDIDA